MLSTLQVIILFYPHSYSMGWVLTIYTVQMRETGYVRLHYLSEFTTIKRQELNLGLFSYRAWAPKHFAGWLSPEMLCRNQEQSYHLNKWSWFHSSENGHENALRVAKPHRKVKKRLLQRKKFYGVGGTAEKGEWGRYWSWNEKSCILKSISVTIMNM